MNILKISLAVLTIGSILSADSIDDKFQSLVGKSLFIGNSSNLHSGHYEYGKEGGNQPELSDSGITIPYYFGDKGDLWRPFVMGGIGYSKMEEENSNLRDTGDDIELTSLYYKIGGGLTYNPTCDFSFVVGGSALVMNTDGDYTTKTPLTTSEGDQKIKKLFDSETTNSIYDGYGGFVYKPTIYGYKSELKSNLHYLKMNFDNGIDDVDGIYLDVMAKVRSNELTTIFCQPVWIEHYVKGDFVNSKLADVIGFNSAVSVGSTLHWRVGPLIPIIKDSRLRDLNVALNVQKTISNRDFEGWKAGVGFSLVKF